MAKEIYRACLFVFTSRQLDNGWFGFCPFSKFSIINMYYNSIIRKEVQKWTCFK